MSRKEYQPEPQELNLEDAIDALLAQVDTTCTEVENPRAGKAIPGALPPVQGASEAPAPQGAASPEASQEPEAPQADETEQPQDAEPEHASAEDQQRDALEALDQVQDMTQSLIEDSIDQLLSETQTQTDTDSSPESPQDESAASETATDVPAEEPVADEADIDAQLDALDGPEATQPEQPVDTQTDTQIDKHTDSQEPAPAESAAAEPASETEPEPLADSDDLLNAIADDLTNAAESPAAPDAAERSPKTHAETLAPDPNAAQSDSDETAKQTTDEPIDEPTPEPTEESNDEGTNREPNREPSQEAGDPVAAQPEPSEQTSAAEADKQSEQDILSTLADLDQTLASGDALLMGDFETPDGDLISSESLQDAHDATALLEQLGFDTLDFETPPPEQADQEATFDAKASLDQAGTDPATQTRGPAQQHPAADEPTPAGQQPSLRPKALEPVPLMLEPDAEVESIWQTARRVIVPRTQHALQLARTHAGPLGARAVLAVNKPIKERPAQLRDSIGYLALWTLLLAVILWVYLAFIRTSPTPTPTQAPSRMMDVQDAGGRVDPLPESP